MYPAISVTDLLNLPVPSISPDVASELKLLRIGSYHARKRAESLLRRASEAVDIAIEKGEHAALTRLSAER